MDIRGRCRSNDERRFEALCEQASNEMDPESRKQLISEILAILEANQRRVGESGVASSDDKASQGRDLRRDNITGLRDRWPCARYLL
jgi:hypothetical protein